MLFTNARRAGYSQLHNLQQEEYDITPDELKRQIKSLTCWTCLHGAIFLATYLLDREVKSAYPPFFIFNVIFISAATAHFISFISCCRFQVRDTGCASIIKTMLVLGGMAAFLYTIYSLGVISAAIHFYEESFGPSHEIVGSEKNMFAAAGWMLGGALPTAFVGILLRWSFAFCHTQTPRTEQASVAEQEEVELVRMVHV